MSTAEELFQRVTLAVLRVQQAKQFQLEAQATLKRASDDLTAAETELAAARKEADDEIDIAIGRKQRDPVVNQPEEGVVVGP